ncbi:MAG: FtsH protease activity modulator HflK [bacterium]|nr:FtsH protease activity modulator HflK [bacterium]
MSKAKTVRRWAKWLLGIAGLVYLLSGFYLVSTNELGVKRRFGRVVDARVSPGLHYRWPYPIEKVDKIKPQEKKRISVGFEFADQAIGRVSNPTQGEFLTGDRNIIKMEMVLQYSILDPVKYLFSFTDPAAIIRDLAKASLAKTTARMNVDEVLEGNGKIAIQNTVLADTQARLDELGQGRRWVQVASINLQNVFPPLEVADAFKDVAAARQDRDRYINEAEGYRREKIPQSRGEAERILREAESYRNEKINTAQGDAQRFIEMCAEYEGSEQVTASRLYLETMEQTMTRMQKVVVDSDSQTKPFDLKIIDLEE